MQFKMQKPATHRAGKSYGLLTSTALALLAVLSPLLLAPARAATIDGTTETVDGNGSGTQPSPWYIASNLFVGDTGEGALVIQNGGVVTDYDSGIGQSATGIGTVTVTGAGSSWSSAALAVGGENQGTLNVLDGGTVNDSDAVLGGGGGAQGTATVSGAGSSWNTANDFTVGLQGTGGLTVSDGGLVSDLTGGIGSQAGSSGTAVVTGSGSRWTNSGDLVVGQDGNGTLTIADGATVSVGGGMGLGLDLGASGVVNIGAATGDAAAAPGTLDASTIVFGDGDATINLNHTGNYYHFGAAMSGDGTINQLAGNTVLTGDSSAFAGTTNVTGGSLYVTGMLGGITRVSTDGILGGTGGVENLHVLSGGTAAPSLATLHVDTVTFDAGSTYRVLVDSLGHSDMIDATGTITVYGGTLRAFAVDGISLGTPYTVVTAAGGGSGAFDTMVYGNDSIFITATPSYDATHVYVEFNQTASFASAAATANQTATANGAESAGPGSGVFALIAAQGSAADAQATFDSFSGEIHASAKSALIEDSHFVRDAALARLRTDADRGRHIWMHAFGATGQSAGDGNAAALDHTTGGLFVGADGDLPSNWRLGVLGGYSHLGLGDKARDSSGDVKRYQIGVYGGTKLSDVAVRVGAAYSLDQVNIDRPAVYGSASYNASTAQAFGELAYRIDAGPARLEPFGNLAYVAHSTGSFTEAGTYAPLSATSDVVAATFTTLGLRGTADLPLGQALKAKLTGMVGWQHGFGDLSPRATVAFDGGDPFVVSGTPIAKDAAVLEGGVSMQLSKAANLDIAYSGRFAAGSHENSLKAGLNVRF